MIIIIHMLQLFTHYQTEVVLEMSSAALQFDLAPCKRLALNDNTLVSLKKDNYNTTQHAQVDCLRYNFL